MVGKCPAVISLGKKMFYFILFHLSFQNSSNKYDKPLYIVPQVSDELAVHFFQFLSFVLQIR